MKKRWLILMLGLLAAASVVIGACGGDDDETANGNETDRAFVAGMAPHHETAIEMAELAQERADSQFVRQLAGDIVQSQSEEITLMRRIDKQLETQEVGIGDLGVPEHLTGMEDEMAALETAQPFDRTFIDMMVAHHAGAIRMARVEIEDGENDQLLALADAIVEAQSREIRQMNQHRDEEFGEPSPSGGVPPEGETASAGGEHDGH